MSTQPVVSSFLALAVLASCGAARVDEPSPGRDAAPARDAASAEDAAAADSGVRMDAAPVADSGARMDAASVDSGAPMDAATAADAASVDLGAQMDAMATDSSARTDAAIADSGIADFGLTADAAAVDTGIPIDGGVVDSGVAPDSGVIADAGVVLPSVAAYYGGGAAQWTAYVARDGAGWFDATGAPCDGDAPGFYSTCIHGGEVLGLVVPGAADCTGLTASDALSTFTWTCTVRGADVWIASTGLSRGRGLADLIDFAAGTWRPNTLTVTDSNGVRLVSQTEPWHQNPIVAVTQPSLDMPGVVYTLAATARNALSIRADGVALVVAPGATLEGAVDTPPASTQRFLWIEGRIEHVGSGYVVRWQNIRRSVLRNVSGDGTVRFTDARSNRVQDLYAAYGGDVVLLDATSTFNLFEDVRVFDYNTTGVRLGGDDNVMAHVLAASGNIGIYVQGSEANAILGATSVANRGRGVWVDGASNTTLSAVAVVNTARGIDLRNATATIQDALITDSFVSSAAAGLGAIEDAGSTATWTGRLILGGHDRACTVGVSEVACATFAPNADISTGTTAAASFVATVSDDAANLDDDAAGRATYAVDLDRLTFATPWRGWGIDGAFPSGDIRDVCDGGTCRIWDWSLLASDVVSRGALALAASATFEHRWSATSSTECAAYAGATFNQGVCSTTAIAHSRELSQDGLGNDNLLCEAGERCLQLPNIGAYQGHGALAPSGTISGMNVELVRFEDNGY